MPALEQARDVFFAAIEFHLMIDEPEFREDPDGVVRTWLRETPHAVEAAQKLLPVLEDDAMNPLPGMTPDEWGFALNTFWALRAALNTTAVGR